MNYKAKFGPGEVWDGEGWMAAPGRDPLAPAMREVLEVAERSAMAADKARWGSPKPRG